MGYIECQSKTVSQSKAHSVNEGIKQQQDKSGHDVSRLRNGLFFVFL